MHESSHETDTQLHETPLAKRGGTQGETAEQLRLRLGLEVRTFQMRWKKRIGPYSKWKVCTAEEIEIMERGASRVVFDNPQTPNAGSDSADVYQKGVPMPYRRPAPKPTPESAATPQKTASFLAIAGVWLEQNRRALALWGVLATGVGTSVPNMYAMTLAIKAGDELSATGVTAAFTLAPALLLLSGSKEWYTRLCIVLVIGYEVFCNASSFYGGLTGLNKSTFIAPTNFLHMATGFAFNSEYEATARIISVFMAAGIASLVAVPSIKLANRYV